MITSQLKEPSLSPAARAQPLGHAAASARRALRVAVVTPIPTPYRDPFWGELAKQPDLDLTVYYCAAGMADHPWKDSWQRDYAFEVLPGRNVLRWRAADASCFVNPGVGRRLAAGQYDAILIGGYNHPTMWQAMLLAARRRIPFFLMCESHQRFRRATWKTWLKQPVMRWIASRAAGFMPTGTLATEYLQSYGASPETMIPLPNVPDVTALQAGAAKLRQSGDRPGPVEFGGRPVVLFVGRLIPKKRPELLIRAFHETAAQHDAVLAIVGDGELRPQLERVVDELNLRSRVHFTGFVQPDEVLRWYARASLFVLPSSETWGAAVLEALAAGIPVIAADEVGAACDMLADPGTGTIVRTGDQGALARAMHQWLQRPADPRAVDTAWQPVRQRLEYTRLAAAVADGLRRLVELRSERDSGKRD